MWALYAERHHQHLHMPAAVVGLDSQGMHSLEKMLFFSDSPRQELLGGEGLMATKGQNSKGPWLAWKNGH